MSEAKKELDPTRLKRGGFMMGSGLVLSAWMGVITGFIATLVTAPFLPFMVLATIPAAAMGLLTVPLFGFTFGWLGIRRAHVKAFYDTKSRELPADHPLRRAVEHLAAKLNLPMPTVAVYPDADVNAFAAGPSPDKAMVSFSQGLLDRMSGGAVLAVAAHELGHIANRDMRRMQYATAFQKSLTWFMGFSYRGQKFLRWCLGWIGELLILRLSRKREYWADATAAALVGKERMIEALRYLENDTIAPTEERLPYAAMMIRMNPHVWFSTHPTPAQRIAALEGEVYILQLPYRAVATERPSTSPAPATVAPEAPQVAPATVSQRALELAP